MKSLLGLVVAASFTIASACGVEPVDRLRELEIVDDEVVASARAQNTTNGPWSFRAVATSLAGSEDEASEIVREAFVSLGPATSRDIVCPWLRDEAENGCDARCESCRSRHLSLARAPLRLIGISNRLDLGEKEGAKSPLGELRFVYAVTRGPGDDPRSTPRAMTVILELAVPPTSSRSRADWAGAWHALGGKSGEAYLASLEALTVSVTQAGQLAQVRTNAAEGEPDPGMRELAIDAEGRLRLRTPEPNVKEAETCVGCHGGHAPAIDGVFHVSPFRSGASKLSRFTLDASAPGEDDLARREAVLRAWLGR